MCSTTPSFLGCMGGGTTVSSFSLSASGGAGITSSGLVCALGTGG